MGASQGASGVRANVTDGHARSRLERRLLAEGGAVVALAAFVFASLFAVMPAPARASASTDAAQFVVDTNRERAAKGVGTLATNDALAGVAQRWSSQMSSSTHLAHNPNLFDDVDRYVTTNWRKVAENVGTGPDVESIQAAFKNSPEHYQNMTDPAFTEIGVAVTYGANGALWVTLDFLQPIPPQQASTAAAAPAPGPAPQAPAPARPAPPLATPAPTVPPTTTPPTTVAPPPPPPTTTPSTEAPVSAAAAIPLAEAPISVAAPGPSGLSPAPVGPHRNAPRLPIALEGGDAVLIAGILLIGARFRADLLALRA